MDLARTRTQPASEAFASHLSSELALFDIGMHRRPVQGAAFSVLKSPDIPSVLVEMGFLSDPVDRANLLNPAWRGQMAQAITRAVTNWRADQAAMTAAATFVGFGMAEAPRQVAPKATKRWVVNSSNPRASHAALDGEEVGIEEDFSNGMPWPGSFTGDPEDVANCQCSLVIIR